MPASNIVTPEHIDILEEDIAAKGAVSEALLRKIAAALNHANYYSALPLGTILENFIPPAQFFNLASNAWVRINGANITNTDYGQWLISQGLDSGTVYLPDARGMELVGVNDGRSDGNQNFVNLSPGQFQANGNKSHGHQVLTGFTYGGSGTTTNPSYIAQNEYSGNNAATPTYSTNNYAGTQSGSHSAKRLVKTDGQAQATSNRIAVYRYIKVWNVAPDL